jgi:ABC-type branched-subunit amino acid transport system ATPase component/MFS family permease
VTEELAYEAVLRSGELDPAEDDPALRRTCREIYGITGGTDSVPFQRGVRDSGDGATMALAVLGLILVADAATGALAIWVTRLAELSLGNIDPGQAWSLRPVAFIVGGVLSVWFFKQPRSRKFWLALAALGQAILLVVGAFAGNGLELLLTEMGAALLSGLVIATALPMVMDAGRPEIRVRLAGGFAAAVLAGVGLSGLVLSLTTIGGWTWRPAFLIVAVLPLVAGLAMFAIREPRIGQWDRAPIRRLLNERVGDDPNAVSEDPPMRLGGRFGRVIGSGTALRALLCGASAGIAIWGLNTYLWTFLRDRWGMTIEARDLLLRTVALGAVPIVVVAAVRLEKAFRASPRHLMWALTFVGPITAGALAIFIVAPWWVLSVIMLLVFTAGAGVLLMAATFLLMSLVDPRFRDAAAVIMVGAALFGGTAAAQLAGIVGQRFGIGWALLIPGFMVLGWSSLGPAQVLIDHDLDSVIGRQVEVAELTARTRLGQRLPLLVCKHIDFSYGQVQVLFNVSFSVSDGEIVALLGTNGAGKTTLLRTISGVAAPSAGSVHYRGEDVTFSGADQRVTMGISQIPGGRAVFGALTVADNLRAYGYTYGRRRSDLSQAIDEAFAGLPKLYERRNQLAQTLSGGEQQMLGVAKAYVIKPRVLLIDELSLGLAPIIVSELLEMVSRINETGTAVVLVEQSVNVALSLAKHAYFMEKGEIRFDGPTDELLHRPELLRSVFLQGATVGLMGSDS